MRVLLVEDDINYLKNHLAEIEKDYVVDVAYTASDGEYLSETNDYDAIVVDSSLPDKPGHCLCRDVRNANIVSPILLLADVEDTTYKVECFKNGVNVCLSKKISAVELSHQIKALTNLSHQHNCHTDSLNNGLTVDLHQQKVCSEGKDLNLRCKEFRVLEYLLLNKNRTVSKEELLDHIWEDGILVKSNSLEVHMRNLRQKIEKPFGTKIIKTVRGFGYKID